MSTVMRSAVLFVAAALAACGGIAFNDTGSADGGTATSDGGTKGKGDNGNIGNGSADGGTAGGKCKVASDCGTNSGASCARVCNDGSNPCEYACSSIGTCVSRGCPEDNAPSGCTPECGKGDICVRSQFNGGAALFVDDAGLCPKGYHASGDICQADPTYACVPRPASCGIPFDCSCADTVCTGGSMCVGNTANQIDCELDAP